MFNLNIIIEYLLITFIWAISVYFCYLFLPNYYMDAGEKEITIWTVLFAKQTALFCDISKCLIFLAIIQYVGSTIILNVCTGGHQCRDGFNLLSLFEVLLVLGLNFDLFLIVIIQFFSKIFTPNRDSDTCKTLMATIGAGTTSSGWRGTSH